VGLARRTAVVVSCLATFACGEPWPTSRSSEPADASVVPADPSVADDGSAATDASPGCPFGEQEFFVVVTDQQTGEAVCDATVVAHGPVSVSFQVQGSEASCSYMQVPQQLAGGSYTVDVTAPGYQPATRTNLLVTTTACGYSAPTVTIALVALASVTDASADHANADAGAGDSDGGPTSDAGTTD
jgi:hypothetical protein